MASKDSSVSVFPESRAMAKHARSSLKRAFKKSKRRKGGKKTLARTVNRILNTKLKVKHASACSQAYANIAHNNLHVVDANIVKTTQGTADPIISDIELPLINDSPLNSRS